MEQRRKTRLRRRFSVRFDIDGLPARGIVKNVSEYGFFLQSNKLMPIGSHLEMICSIDRGLQGMLMQGRVVAVYHDPSMAMLGTSSSEGMGVELINPPEDYLRFIAGLRGETFVEKEEKELPPAAEVVSAPPLLKNFAPRDPDNAGKLGVGKNDFIVPELLVALQRKNFTGILGLVRGMVRKAVYLKRGEICHVESMLDSEKLGQYLVRRGTLSDDKLQEALKKQKSGHLSIGQILLDQGFIDSTALIEAVNGQHEDKVVNTFAWFDGEYIVTELPDLPANLPRFNMDLYPLILQGIQRFYDQNVLHWLLPLQDSTVVKPTCHDIALVKKIPAKISRLLNKLSQPTSVKELGEFMKINRDELAQYLLLLLIAGWAQLS